MRERLHELLQEFAGAIAAELAMFIDKLVDTADGGFGLRHREHVQKHDDASEISGLRRLET
jgi:hypothetical protein